MNTQDAGLVNDTRVQHISDEAGVPVEAVVEIAEVMAEEFGDTVEDEINSAVEMIDRNAE